MPDEGGLLEVRCFRCQKTYRSGKRSPSERTLDALKAGWVRLIGIGGRWVCPACKATGEFRNVR